MLALITGNGALPGAVAQAHGAPCLVCTLAGHQPKDLASDVVFRLETLGTLFETLKDNGVDRVCLCGAIGRPTLDPSALDAATLPFVPRFQEALSLGDDGALRIVMALFEEQGFDILPAHLAAPALLPEAGIASKAVPDASVRRDVALGDAALRDMARADLGQACIIDQGKVVLTEDDEGTNALVEKASGGFLFKAPKPGQDLRADLPTIGPKTAQAAAQSGLSGLVVEAGSVIVLDLPETLSILDAHGMFLWVREATAE